MEIEDPASEPTGGLRPLASSLPKISGSTAPASSPSSSTTGRALPAVTGSNRPGTAPSGTDVAPSQIGAWVDRQLGPFRLPEATVRSMTSSLSSHVKPENVTAITSDGQYEVAKVRLTMVPGMPRKDALSDLRTLDSTALRPADKNAVAPLVAVLKARTKSRNTDAQEARFEAQVLVQDLSAYPIDVVQWACEYWVAGGADNKWMPSWPELRELCERRVQPRRALRKALEWVAAGEPVNA